MKLHCDFETRSVLNLETVGLDNYTRHPSTQALMLSWAIDEEPVQLWQIARGEAIPQRLSFAIRDSRMKCAWNAGFERMVFERQLGIKTAIDEWIDPCVRARYVSMPGKLERVCTILQLGEQGKKDGKRLIDKFCMPRIQDMPLFQETNGVWFADWNTEPRDWELFCDYCIRDTEVERTILNWLEKFGFPENEQAGWVLDQQINLAGIPFDKNMLYQAVSIAGRAKDALLRRATEITGLENPNSIEQLLPWVRERGYSYGSLKLPLIESSLLADTLPPECREALMIRKDMAKTSDLKLPVLQSIGGADDRVRNQYVYLGAARAGRWSGRDVQPQNMPRPSRSVKKRLDRAIELICAGDYDTIEKEFGSPLDVVGSTIRSIFRAPAGYKFVVCDLNAIEVRVLGYLARCERINDIFRQGRDPYLVFACDLPFGMTYEELLAEYEAGNDEHRQQSKAPVLGGGYGLGGGKEIINGSGDLVRTGLWGYALSLGINLTQKQSKTAVRVYRSTYIEVPALWEDLEYAARKAIRNGDTTTVGPVTFDRMDNVMRVLLPSGRRLHYINARFEDVDFEGELRETICYDGQAQQSKKWGRITTWGGKLTENIDQAISRDILLHGMQRAAERGFEIVGHAHDEIISLVPDKSLLDLEDLRHCMSMTPPWAEGLLLDANGYEAERYRKG